MQQYNSALQNTCKKSHSDEYGGVYPVLQHCPSLVTGKEYGSLQKLSRFVHNNLFIGCVLNNWADLQSPRKLAKKEISWCTSWCVRMCPE